MKKHRNSFQRFAEDYCRGYSPLYELLSMRVSVDEDMLGLAKRAQPEQPECNLLFGSVHYLLLEDDTDPLADYFPSVGGTRAADEQAWRLFVDFVSRRKSEMIPLIENRRVQTNEVRRCTALLPALAATNTKRLHLVEVGPSAGLNLLVDRWAYRYSNGVEIGDSELVLTAEVRGTEPPPLEPLDIVGRVGIDIHPVDITDPDEARWLKALIWPELVERCDRLDTAIRLAAEDPPQLIAGDGLELLPEVIERAPADDNVCVFNTYAACQMGDEGREWFRDVLDSLDRPIQYVAIEQARGDEWPMIRVNHQLRGRCHFHGEWVEWGLDPS